MKVCKLQRFSVKQYEQMTVYDDVGWSDEKAAVINLGYYPSIVLEKLRKPREPNSDS
jgi:hypothetical protein